VVVVLLLIPGDAVGVVPVPGEVEREEAAPHQVARHPTETAALSIQSTSSDNFLITDSIDNRMTNATCFLYAQNCTTVYRYIILVKFWQTHRYYNIVLKYSLGAFELKITKH